MIRLMCAVFDSAAQTFGQPMFVVAKGQAVRSFQDEVQRKAGDNILNAHPEDFALYALGEFDDLTGSFNVPPHPEVLVRGKDCAIVEN